MTYKTVRLGQNSTIVLSDLPHLLFNLYVVSFTEHFSKLCSNTNDKLYFICFIKTAEFCDKFICAKRFLGKACNRVSKMQKLNGYKLRICPSSFYETRYFIKQFLLNKDQVVPPNLNKMNA